MTMTPKLRKFSLTTHIISSVGLLGSIAAFLALSIAGLNSQDEQIIRAAYLSMDLVARFIIVPLALASLLTGLIQSFGTPWGLFRHYWILAKLLVTAFATTILLIKLEMIGYAAHLAAQVNLPRSELSTVGMELRFHAAAGLLVLLVPAVLSVYKPRGVTPYGRRKQEKQKGSFLQENARTRRQWLSLIPGAGFSTSLSGTVTVTLRRMHVFGFVAAILVAHLIILHVIGAGPISH